MLLAQISGSIASAQQQQPAQQAPPQPLLGQQGQQLPPQFQLNAMQQGYLDQVLNSWQLAKRAGQDFSVSVRAVGIQQGLRSQPRFAAQ